MYIPSSCLMYQVLTLSQRLQIANARLNAELRTLRGTGAASAASSTTSTKAAATEETLLHRSYRNHGKRFAAPSELWINGSILRRPYPERFRSLGLWHPERWANDTAWEEGTVAELYSILPESCHDLAENSPLFAKMVSLGARGDVPTQYIASTLLVLGQ